ncbi:MAG: alanine racemase [Christensenellales bacterium]|nr:alanine racemase [Eubacteriales bacterium]
MQNVTIFIDLGALKDNLAALKSAYKTRLLFMVKCNAYGHGLVPVAAAADEIVDYFGVATLAEGRMLKAAGIKKPVLAGCIKPGETAAAIDAELVTAVFSAEQYNALSAAAKAKKKKVSCHVKIDSGMNRLGFKSEGEITALARRLKADEFVGIEGAYSHISSQETKTRQLERFLKLAEPLKELNKDLILHIASGKIGLTSPECRLGMVRAGLAAYGYSDITKPVMTAAADVLQAKPARRGEEVSYGHTPLERNVGLAVIGAGYGDGVPRSLATKAVIRGRVCAAAGIPCMDMTVVKTEGFLAKEGEAAVFLGGEMTAEAVAEASGRIPYEILTGFHGRCEYLYFD